MRTEYLPVVSHHLPLTLPPGPLPQLLPGEALEDDVGLQAVRRGTSREVTAPHDGVKARGGRPEERNYQFYRFRALRM